MDCKWGPSAGMAENVETGLQPRAQRKGEWEGRQEKHVRSQTSGSRWAQLIGTREVDPCLSCLCDIRQATMGLLVSQHHF